MCLTAPQSDVDASTNVAEHHADLVGPPQGDQPDCTDDMGCDVTLTLAGWRLSYGIPAGVGDHENLMVLLGDETFDQDVARPCGGLPIDVADVVARHIGS